MCSVTGADAVPDAPSVTVMNVAWLAAVQLQPVDAVTGILMSFSAASVVCLTVSAGTENRQVPICDVFGSSAPPADGVDGEPPPHAADMIAAAAQADRRFTARA
jgi:hypothetical protein